MLKPHLRLDAMRHSLTLERKSGCDSDHVGKCQHMAPPIGLQAVERHLHQDRCHPSLPDSCAFLGMRISGSIKISSE